MIEVPLDKIPGNNESATIVYWAVEEGDRTEEDDEIAKLSIDGKTFVFFSPAAGIVHEIYYGEGEEVKLNEVIATIEEDTVKKGSSEEALDLEETL